MKIDKWALSLNSTYGFFINKEAYENATNRKFEESDYYLNGITKLNSDSKKQHINVKVKAINDNQLQSTIGNTYELLNKHELYIKYEDAIKNNMPVIYDWYIGNDNDILYITGTIYCDSEFYDFIDIIIEQKHDYIILENNGKSLVLWGVVNRIFRNSIKDQPELLNKLYNCEFIDIFKYKHIFNQPINFKESFIGVKNKKFKKIFIDNKKLIDQVSKKRA